MCAAAVRIANRLSSGLHWLVSRKWAFREIPMVDWVFLNPLVVDSEKVVCPLHVYFPSK